MITGADKQLIKHFILKGLTPIESFRLVAAEERVAIFLSIFGEKESNERIAKMVEDIKYHSQHIKTILKNKGIQDV